MDVYPNEKILNEVFRYDCASGVLYWRERGPEWFKNEAYARRWNARCAGKPALNSANSTGHKGGYFCDVQFSAHRVIWKMHYGTEPKEIDHINGDPSDNRIVNLRAVSHGVNLRNQKRRSTNTSGHMGVRRSRNGQRWQARIKAAGVERYLGTFEKFEDAIAARKQAERKHGFHENHGRG